MPNNDTNGLLITEADKQIRECLDSKFSFSVIAGAGSGKTTSLVSALDYIRGIYGKELRRDGKQIACITFTNRAVDVISSRLGWDDIYLVSTLHSFLWREIKRFTKEIKQCLLYKVIPLLIEKQREKDNGGNSQRAIAARAKIASLTEDMKSLESVKRFTYDDMSTYSNYPQGKLSHDDIIAVSGYLISENEILKKIIGQKYPFIFVDEAQDTFNVIVDALNEVCEGEGEPIIGYFGDPMQQIYEKRAGDFHGPDGSVLITKKENFRCSPEVISLLNSFRHDVEQYPAGDNAHEAGSVELILIQADTPEAPRNRYSDAQLDKVAYKFDELLCTWGWSDQKDVKLLFLVRQMIARRLGFIGLHTLFTSEYSSTRAKESYESGDNLLLKPFLKVIWPLVFNHKNSNVRTVMNILREYSPAFNPEGVNSHKSLKEMLSLADTLVKKLVNIWERGSVGEVLKYVVDSQLCSVPDQLVEDILRDPMTEEYNEELHSTEKGRWLADSFFEMDTSEIPKYADFINENTPFSTQHGVKGEEYKNVVVLFDDVEAYWNQYSFAKTLTPNTSGDGSGGQIDRTQKLAYVCFSRAEVNLKIIFFSLDPSKAKAELINSGLFLESQISIETL